MTISQRPIHTPGRKIQLGVETLEARSMASVAFPSISNPVAGLPMGTTQQQSLNQYHSPRKLSAVLDYVNITFGSPMTGALGYGGGSNATTSTQFNHGDYHFTLPAETSTTTQAAGNATNDASTDPNWHPIGYRAIRAGHHVPHSNPGTPSAPSTPTTPVPPPSTPSAPGVPTTPSTPNTPSTPSTPTPPITISFPGPTTTPTTPSTPTTPTTPSTPVTTPSTPVTTPTMQSGMGLSINVEAPVDYASPMFTDLMMQSRGFGDYSAGWNNIGNQPMGTDGYPTGDFGVVVATNVAPGTYAFQCKGNPAISFDGDQMTHSLSYDASTNLTTGTITVDRMGETFNMSFKQGSQRVTDIKVMRPGYAMGTTQMFTTDFLSKLKGYNTLRFMDWDRTNGNQLVKWADRPGASSGWSLESQIELCKEAGTNGWFNVPAMADDDYITHMADLLKSQMGNRKVFIEYSNELWNPGFSQSHWAYDQSQAAFQANPNDPKLIYGFSSSSNAAQWPWSIEQNWLAGRTAHVSQLFHQEFAATPGGAQLQFVLAGQLSNSGPTENTLNWTKAFAGDPKGLYEDIAGAPYIQLNDTLGNSDTLTKDQVLAGEFDYFKAEVIPTMQKWGQLSKTWGIGLVTYEGAIDTYGTHSFQAKSDAYMDPRTHDLDLMLLTAAEQAGFQDFAYYHIAGSLNQWDMDSVYLVNDMSLVTPNQLALQDFAAGQRMQVPAANPW